MRAALMERGRIWVEDVPDPTPAEGEVVVKSVACGICGSDLHAARHTEEFVATSIEAGGAFKLTTFDPVVLGHEFCAEVMETRGDLRAGDLVCSVPALDRPVTVGVGYSTEAPGGFGEYMLLSERLLMPVPDGTPKDHAALTEPMAVGYHASTWRASRGTRASSSSAPDPWGCRDRQPEGPRRGASGRFRVLGQAARAGHRPGGGPRGGSPRAKSLRALGDHRSGTGP